MKKVGSPVINRPETLRKAKPKATGTNETTFDESDTGINNENPALAEQTQKRADIKQELKADQINEIEDKEADTQAQLSEDQLADNKQKSQAENRNFIQNISQSETGKSIGAAMGQSLETALDDSKLPDELKNYAKDFLKGKNTINSKLDQISNAPLKNFSKTTVKLLTMMSGASAIGMIPFIGKNKLVKTIKLPLAYMLSYLGVNGGSGMDKLARNEALILGSEVAGASGKVSETGVRVLIGAVITAMQQHGESKSKKFEASKFIKNFLPRFAHIELKMTALNKVQKQLDKAIGNKKGIVGTLKKQVLEAVGLGGLFTGLDNVIDGFAKKFKIYEINDDDQSETNSAVTAAIQEETLAHSTAGLF